MPRQSCRLHSSWMIVVDSSRSATEEYLFFHLDDCGITEVSLFNVFPNAFIERIPPYMNTVITALHKNTIHCSFCSDSLYDYIGKILRDNSYPSLLAQKFSESFEDQCIEVVRCSYILEAKNGVIRSLRTKKDLPFSEKTYEILFYQWKLSAINKRAKRHRDEMYLGKLSFGNELLRSFHEVVATVEGALGFSPYNYN
jgi:hypothetical protein